MVKTNRLLLILFSACIITAALPSCTRIKNYLSFRQDDKNPVIARVYDSYLYKSDLPNLVPAGASKQDSTAIIDRYIDSWVTRQLILNATQMSMPAGDLEKELAEFKELLLTGRYEQYIISERLDTSVSEAEIRKYYEENTENFILHKDIVLVLPAGNLLR